MARGPAPLRLLQRLLGPADALRWVLRLYPPFLGAGIVCSRVSPDLRTIEVELRARPWNRNYVGTHFGGSLFAMTDPFYMLLLLHALGDRAVVWDRAATIRFLRPGRGTVRARFHLDEARLEDIAARLEGARSLDEPFTVEVTDEEGRVVAVVEKVVYLRPKTAPAPSRAAAS